ncbi:MAG: cobalamin-dependent protein [Candidatus Omnitrophica bacterium]|nr:cobalamin-dependent protein [Candidatus Omnitrophota bacterium]
MNVILISMQENLCTFGIRYVFYETLKAGHRAILVYPNLRSEITEESRYLKFAEALPSFLRKNNPDVVGISFMSYQSALVRRICGDIKRIDPRVVLAGGGIHVTAFPESSLEFFDAVCLGEGEISFAEFLKCYEQKGSLENMDVPGIVTAAGSARPRAAAPLFRDMDSLAVLPVMDESAFFYGAGRFAPIRAADVGRFQRYNGNGYDITTSRGCPLECTYCADNINKNLYGNEWKRVRLRSVDHVMKELIAAVSSRPTIRFINFHDDSFTSRPLSWFQDFVPRYLRDIKLPLMFRMIPGSANDDKYRLLSQLSVIAAGIGLQSGSYRVLSEVYKRPVKISTFVETSRRLSGLRMMPIIDVMLDNPYEFRNDIVETVETLASLPKPFLLELYGFRFYPGTEITARALKEGVITECDLYKTQATIESRGDKKFLNNIIFITPHIPAAFVRFLVRRENSLPVRCAMPLLTFYGSIMNAKNFLFMIVRSHGYNPVRIMKFLYLTADPVTSICHAFPFLRNLITRGRQD